MIQDVIVQALGPFIVVCVLTDSLEMAGVNIPLKLHLFHPTRHPVTAQRAVPLCARIPFLPSADLSIHT